MNKVNKKLMNYLTKEEEHIKDTFSSFLKNHLNMDYNEDSYSKFRTHWRAITTQMLFGAFAKKYPPGDYFDMRNYIEDELNKNDTQIVDLINKYYSKAYSAGGLDTPKILNSHCFDGKLSEAAIDEFNRGFALIHEFIIENLT